MPPPCNTPSKRPRSTCATLGENHPVSLTCLGYLGSLHAEMGDHAKVLTVLQRVRTLWAEAMGEGDEHLGWIFYRLGEVYQAMGDLDAAVPAYERSTQIYRDAVGENVRLADSLTNLANVHLQLGKPEAALRSTSRPSGSAVRYSARSPQYADSLHNLALAHQAMGDHAAALPLNRQALEIRRAAPGEDHPTCGASMSSLAKAHERGRLRRRTTLARASDRDPPRHSGGRASRLWRESVQPGWSASSPWGTTPPL